MKQNDSGMFLVQCYGFLVHNKPYGNEHISKRILFGSTLMRENTAIGINIAHKECF